MMKRGLLVLGGVAALLLAAAASTATRAGEDADKEVKKEVKKVVIFRSGGSWLGVQIADVDADRAGEIGLKEEMGAEIQSVSPGSPAEAAGLQKGDVILEYQGTRIEGVMQLTRLVRETPPGREASVKIFRDGAARTVQVKVGGRDHDADVNLGELEHRLEGLHDIPDVRMLVGPHGGPRLGAVVDSLGTQLAEYFGVKQGGGVLVRSVHKGGPGDAAGLRAGDVIIRIDDAKVEDEGDLRLALRERRGKEFKLTVVRDRREQTLTIPAPPEDRTGSHGGPGAPAVDRERIRRDVERAMRDAAAARAWAMEEKAAEDAAEDVEEALEEVEDAGEEVDSIRDERQRERDEIRRAVVEARRIRIEMQQAADE